MDSHTIFRNISSLFGNIEHFELLKDYGTVCSDPINVAELSGARAHLRNHISEHGLLDAAGVVANFMAITRIVDLTGHKKPELSYIAAGTNVLVYLRKYWILLVCSVIILFWKI